ncbi:MAG TPA: sensor histidine kinase [Terriglobales bacterium]|nr:sensor histidine kinase [Terriglobales bacterium]
MRLLPKNRDHGWAPYTWLVYYCFFLLNPILHHAGWKEWLATGLGTAAFLALYFSFFWFKRPWNLLNIAGMVLGVSFSPFNEGACTFFVFAAAFIPFAVEKESTALKLLATVLAVVTLEWWLLHFSGWFLFYGGGLSTVVGAGNIFFAQRNRANERLRKANEEIEHLAKVAERERIARDLHDVLGHTLSVIILKSELAGKLVDHDPERAKAEIADVEQTSRAALADVRSTIRGYRAHSLEAELNQAKATLETAGVTVTSESEEVRQTPAQESVVALVVREAVTNVVRHAQARNCHLRLMPINGNCRIDIQDDGRGGAVEGNGLRGMRERIEALGGTLERENSVGTRLSIQFPLTQTKENINH